MQPPTDNLYKFLAISGLIVFGFSIYIPFQRFEEFERSSVQLDIVYEPIIDKLMVVDDAALIQLNCSISKRGGGKPKSSDPCKRVKEAKAVAAAATRELVALQAKVTNVKHERNLLFEQYRRSFVAGIFLGVLGLALCIAGFWLWYVRLQRYLDAVVRDDAQQRNREHPR